MSKPSKIIKLMKNIKPTRMWIDGKCFTISKHEDKIFSNNEIINSYLEEYKLNYDINFVNDLYHTTFRMPSIYYEKLRGFPNFTIKELEEHTNASINVPHHESNEYVVVSSKDIKNVIDARSKLHSVLSVIRESQRVLQFIAIPVINDNIKTKFENFKKEVLQEEVDGMHESIFQKPERLHLTIGVFSLLDDVEKTEAIKVLNECKDIIINPIVLKNGPLKIKVCGLDCMNNDYSKVNILYANAKVCTKEDEDVLQSIVNSISSYFYERGLIRQYQENVKVHITLINTKYRKIEGRKRKWKDIKKTFDASTIMEKYKNFHFGDCDFNEVHLSWISKIDDNGFYKPLSIIAV